MRNLYKQYGCPLVRVVRGLPTSWELTAATMYSEMPLAAAAWSPCGRFIALVLVSSATIEIVDATTLRRVKTFTSPSYNTQWLSFSPDGRRLTGFDDRLDPISWDLQTGGLVNIISSDPHVMYARCFSSTHSEDGKVVAVAYGALSLPSTPTSISIYDLVSRAYVYSHRVSEGRIVASLWTHNQCLRFASVKPGSITLWEVGFTSIGTLTEFKTLPAPEGISDAEELLFLPTLSRLAFTLQEAVLVWDAQGSRFLLNFKSRDLLREIKFSPDGRFFACGTLTEGVRIWKEAPAGYTLHQELVSNTSGILKPFFSPNGESIIACHRSGIRQWYTKYPTPPLPDVSNQPVRRFNFMVGLSPDETFAATTRLYEKSITILDLESGEPRLIIDAGMEILCLRVTERAVVVVGEGKVVTWDVPASGRVLGARANVNDSARTTTFDRPGQYRTTGAPFASISPDLNLIAIAESTAETPNLLTIFDVSTGKRLASTTHRYLLHLWIPWFTPDGHDIWCSGEPEEGWTIIEGDKPDHVKLNPVEPGVSPLGGFPWRSSRGYEITPDGWVLSPSGKRLLWLPHSWRLEEVSRMWGDRFLGLLHGTLPEVVILGLSE